MHRRYWTLVTVLALLSGVALGAQERTVEETVTLEPGGRLSIKNSRGSVQLTSWDQPRVEVRARIEAPPDVDEEYGQRAIDGTTINVSGTDRSVRIRADYEDVPGRWWFDRRHARVHYEIRAPRELDLTLDIDRNDASVRGFEGAITIHLDRSDLDAADLTGEVTMDLDRSRLDMSDVTGQISLKMDRGRDIVLDGVTASFDLDLDRTAVTMRNVTIDGDSAVKIDRGALDLELHEQQVLSIDADMSRRSDFSSDLPIAMQETGRKFRGTINGGGTRLRIRADRGDIQLRTP